jgi:bifunctional oligoribonuclease and PAP phosphatase NrnA
MNKEQITSLKSFLSTPKKIVIIGHRNPDGDAMGSTLALCHYLKKKGHNAQVIMPNDFPDFLKWMPGANEVKLFENDRNKTTSLISEAQLIFTLDFNSLSRVGEDFEKVLKSLETPFAIIDHHQQPDDYATYLYSDVSICSTAQMVYHFIEMMDDLFYLDKDIATCIYTGIVTDTGSFRYSSTTATTHRVAAHLIEQGINNAFIHQSLFDNNSAERMQLLGVALQNLVILKEFNTAYITITQDDLDKHNFQKGDTEGFVNYGLSVKNVKFAAIFIENKQDKITKISFRSLGTFDVNQFARNYFEGGGHINAAGAKSNLKLDETVSYFITKLQVYKQELSNA